MPAVNVKSLAGMYLNDLGAFTSTSNSFEGLTCGIWTSNVNMGIKDNNFLTMQNNITYYPGFSFHGIGINMIGGLDNMNVTSVEGCNFDGTTVATNLLEVTTTYQRNSTVNSNVGLRVEPPKVGTVTIGGDDAVDGNTVSAEAAGIWISGFTPNCAIDVGYNHVTLEGPNGAFGIGLDGIPGDANITQNRITVEEEGRGIFLRACQENYVGYNFIDLQSTTAAAQGIVLRGSQACRLTRNGVAGSGVSTNSTGIHIESSSGNEYCSNDLYDTNIGVRVSGLSQSESLLRATEFNDHTVGLQIDAGTQNLLGTQDHTENEWKGSYNSGFGARWDVSLAFAQAYPFRVDPSQNPAYDTGEDPIGWFELGTSPNAINFYSNDAECRFLAIGGLTDPNTPDKIRIAEGNTGLDSTYPSALWDLELWLYEHIVDASGLAPEIDTFRMSSDSSGLADYYEISDSWEISIDRDTTLLIDDLSKQGALLNALEGLITSDQTTKLSGITTIDSLERLSSMGKADGRTLELIQKMTVIRSLYGSEVTSHLALNTALYGSVNAAQNTKSMNAVFFDHFNEVLEDLSSADSVLLADLAQACPLVDGIAVYYARALLAVYTGVPIVYDDSNCGSPQSLQRNSDNGEEVLLRPSKNTALQRLHVFPNPARDQVVLSWIPFDTQGTLVLIDQHGRQLAQWSINGQVGRFELDLSSYAAGLYHLKMQTDETEMLSKVVIE